MTNRFGMTQDYIDANYSPERPEHCVDCWDCGGCGRVNTSRNNDPQCDTTCRTCQGDGTVHCDECGDGSLCEPVRIQCSCCCEFHLDVWVSTVGLICEDCSQDLDDEEVGSNLNLDTDPLVQAAA